MKNHLYVFFKNNFIKIANCTLTIITYVLLYDYSGIKNVRNSESSKQLCADLTRLVKSTRGYCVEYSCTDGALSEIDRILTSK